MRFHHSTRRGRNRLGHHNQHPTNHRLGSHHSTSRWSQMGYCRETNIHFNRRLPVEPPVVIPAATSYMDHSRESLLSVDDRGDRVGIQEDAQGHQANGNSTTAQSSQALPSGDKPTHQHQHQQQQLDERLHQMSLEDNQRAPARRQTSLDQAAQNNQHTRQSGRQVNKHYSSPIELLGPAHQCIDMESARKKLVAQVEKHPFWSNKAAKRMQLTSVEQRRIFIYELVSFCERRDLEWRYEPYRGGLVSSIPFRRVEGATSGSMSQPLSAPAASTDRLHNQASTRTAQDEPPWTSGAAPHATPAQSSMLTSSGCGGSSGLSSSRQSSSKTPIRRSCSSAVSGSTYEPVSAIEQRRLPSAELVWSIEVPQDHKPEPFSGHVHSTELPNSSFVKRCHGCQGKGKLKCNSCYGVGYEVCISCSGKGTTKSMAAGATSAMRSSGRYYSANDAAYSPRNSTYANGYDNQDQDSTSADCDQRRGGRGGYEPGGISSSGSGAGHSAWLTESCHFCHGAGQKRCWVCAGKSYNHCFGCLGAGQLRCYLNLIVTWINHRDESLLNNADNIIPRERLRLSSGLLLADESSDRLAPLSRLDTSRHHHQHRHTHLAQSSSLPTPPPPDCQQNQQQQHQYSTVRVDEGNQLYHASKRLLDHHKLTYRTERLIKQRHKLTQIESHVVNYEWKQIRGHFVIYGDERKVYIAKYPFKSICNIT